MLVTKLQQGIELILDREGHGAIFDIHDDTLFIGDAESFAYAEDDRQQLTSLGFFVLEGSFAIST